MRLQIHQLITVAMDINIDQVIKIRGIFKQETAAMINNQKKIKKYIYSWKVHSKFGVLATIPHNYFSDKLTREAKTSNSGTSCYYNQEQKKENKAENFEEKVNWMSSFWKLTATEWPLRSCLGRQDWIFVSGGMEIFAESWILKTTVSFPLLNDCRFIADYLQKLLPLVME